MRPNEFTKRLAGKLNELKENMDSTHKRIQHEIAQLRVEIGPDNWDATYRVAVYLAIKNVTNDVMEEEDEFNFE